MTRKLPPKSLEHILRNQSKVPVASFLFMERSTHPFLETCHPRCTDSVQKIKEWATNASTLFSQTFVAGQKTCLLFLSPAESHQEYLYSTRSCQVSFLPLPHFSNKYIYSSLRFAIACARPKSIVSQHISNKKHLLRTRRSFFKGQNKPEII